MKKIFLDSLNEDTNNSRKKQGKRALANSEGTLLDLNLEAKKLFKAFYDAKDDVNNSLALIPVQYRLGSTQAQLLQCFLAKNLEKYFPNNFRRGKNSRLIIYLNGYVILFKKLNSKGYPMNIKTETVDAISNQSLTLNLFENDGYEPILYFGYEVNRVGDLINPRIIYIDDNVIKFTLSEDQFNSVNFIPKKGINKAKSKDVKPKLKNKDNRGSKVI
jgi:hypothetical protein